MHDGEGEIVGVVLAAGASRRLGRPKQTLPFGSRTLLGHVMADVEGARSLDHVVLVTGGAATEAVAGLEIGRARIAHNDSYGTGCASSLLAGLDTAATVSDDVAAIVMLLGDMPGVTPIVIDEVVRSWRSRPTWAAVTEYRGGLGHPFVFSAAAFPMLRSLHGDKAVWKIVDNEPPARVRRIDVDIELPLDVDTWDDYREICGRFGFEPAPLV